MDFRIAEWIQALAAFDAGDWNSIGFWVALWIFFIKYRDVTRKLIEWLGWALKRVVTFVVGAWFWLLRLVSR